MEAAFALFKDNVGPLTLLYIYKMKSINNTSYVYVVSIVN